MKTLLERSLRLLDPSKFSGSEVVEIDLYLDGTLKQIKARIGRSEIEQISVDGTTFTAKVQDFIVASADLVVGSSIVEPRKGDRIEWKRNAEPSNDSDKYDVLPLNGGRCVEPMDAYGVLYRIHTKWSGHVFQ